MPSGPAHPPAPRPEGHALGRPRARPLNRQLRRLLGPLGWLLAAAAQAGTFLAWLQPGVIMDLGSRLIACF